MGLEKIFAPGFRPVFEPCFGSGRFVAALLLLLSLGGCDLANDEAERTKAQLGRITQQTGIDGAAAAVGDVYTRHVAPVVQPVVTETSDAMNTLAIYQDVKQSGGEAFDAVKRTCEPYFEAGQDLFNRMPQSERELQELVLGYNDEFAAWLRQQAGSLRNQRYGRGRLSSLSGGGVLAGVTVGGGRRPTYTRPTDVHSGGGRKGPTR